MSQMLTVALRTRAGHPVATVGTPPFERMPAVIFWAGRAFTGPTHIDDGGVFVYHEVEWHLVEPEPPEAA